MTKATTRPDPEPTDDETPERDLLVDDDEAQARPYNDGPPLPQEDGE